MGDGGCVVDEEWLRFVLLDELLRVVEDFGVGEVVAVVLGVPLFEVGWYSFGFLVGVAADVIEKIGLMVVPEVLGIVAVGSALAEVAVEGVEAVVHRSFAGLGSAKAPLTEDRSLVAGCFEVFGDGYCS